MRAFIQSTASAMMEMSDAATREGIWVQIRKQCPSHLLFATSVAATAVRYWRRHVKQRMTGKRIGHFDVSFITPLNYGLKKV